MGINNFSKTDAQYFPAIHTVFDVPTDYTPYLIKRAITRLKKIYRKEYLYKRVGVMLTDVRSRQGISLKDKKLIISLPETANFSRAYEVLHPAITNSIGRIRKREVDLEFTIWSKNQERDFKILK